MPAGGQGTCQGRINGVEILSGRARPRGRAHPWSRARHRRFLGIGRFPGRGHRLGTGGGCARCQSPFQVGGARLQVGQGLGQPGLVAAADLPERPVELRHPQRRGAFASRLTDQREPARCPGQREVVDGARLLGAGALQRGPHLAGGHPLHLPAHGVALAQPGLQAQGRQRLALQPQFTPQQAQRGSVVGRSRLRLQTVEGLVVQGAAQQPPRQQHMGLHLGGRAAQGRVGLRHGAAQVARQRPLFAAGEGGAQDRERCVGPVQLGFGRCGVAAHLRRRAVQRVGQRPVRRQVLRRRACAAQQPPQEKVAPHPLASSCCNSVSSRPTLTCGPAMTATE